MDIIVTNAGRAALINAVNTGMAPVTIAQVGFSATAITPTATMTALAGEFKRVATVAGEVVADDVIHVSITDASTDAFTVRAFGLYLSDGTLFAVYGQAAPILEKTASSIAALAVDAVLADIDAATITFGATDFTNPPATTEMQGVVELATIPEAQAGIDALRALTPASAKAAILGWLLAQDGSGCGLDADLLDGQHGNYYTNITARLGYTPLNAATYTAADILAKLITVDGSGSGVDADMLDGQDGAYYGNVVARLGYTPVQQGTGIGQLTGNVVKVGWSGSRLKATVDTTDMGNLVSDTHLDGGALPHNGSTMRRSGNHLWGPDNDGSGSGLDADLLDGQHGNYYTDISARLGFTPINKAGDSNIGPLDFLSSGAFLRVGGKEFIWTNGTDLNIGYQIANVTIQGYKAWHANNDGSGSGLDADLLDGYQAASFAKYGDWTSGSNANGKWFRDPSGKIRQYGTITISSEATVVVTLPIPFPTENLFSSCNGATSNTASEEWPTVKAWTQDNITILNGNSSSITIQWMAEGI